MNDTDSREKGRFAGKEVWQCIRDLQHGRRGRMPTRVVAVDNEDGRLCTTTTEQQERQKRKAQLLKVKQRQTDEELGQPPTKNEVRRALGKLVEEWQGTWKFQHTAGDDEGWKVQ